MILHLLCLSVLVALSLWTTGGVRSWSEHPVGAASLCSPPGWMTRCACLVGGVGLWCCHCGVPPWGHICQLCCSVAAPCTSCAVLTGDGSRYRSTLGWEDYQLCKWGKGLFRWDMTSSPGRALTGLRPYFKGLTFSAMTVKPRRLKYPGLYLELQLC